MTNHLIDEKRNQSVAQLRNMRFEVINKGLNLLRADLQNPDLSIPENPDGFIIHANSVGFALFEAGLFSLAREYYQVLLDETLRYRQISGNWRHAGALFANKAAACVAQGNLDEAVILLLRAAEDDEKTYGVDRRDSFAITDLLSRYFRDPVMANAMNAVQDVNPNITIDSFNNLGAILQERELALIAFLSQAFTHIEANNQFSNEFSQLQVFSAISNLSVLLETELKLVSGDSGKTLYSVACDLYKKKDWWAKFVKALEKDNRAEKSGETLIGRLQKALEIKPLNDDSMFWKSLLIAYIIRNHTAHQLEVASEFVQDYSMKAIGHILNAMVAAPSQARVI